MLMLSGDHGDEVLGSNNSVGLVHGMLKHGTASDESAIPFGLVSPEPSLNERFEPFFVTPASTTDHRSFSLNADSIIHLSISLRRPSILAQVKDLQSIGCSRTHPAICLFHP